MQEEIKEILNRLNDYDNYKYRNDNGLSYKEIEGWEIDLLLDYITNLQEENERLKEQCKEWKENHKAVCIQRDNILDNIVKDTEDRIDYKSRNEKALELLLDKYVRGLLNDNEVNNIVKILKGDNK